MAGSIVVIHEPREKAPELPTLDLVYEKNQLNVNKLCLILRAIKLHCYEANMQSYEVDSMVE